MSQQKGLVGITSTIASEIVLAAGLTPIDLNNVFIGSSDPGKMISDAASAGYPDTCCAWIKGIYSAAMADPRIRTIVGVEQGDCSNTTSLLNTLSENGKRVIHFAYPRIRSVAGMKKELERFASELGTNIAAAEKWRADLAGVRGKLRKLDEMTWSGGVVSGQENHEWLVASSDFGGDPEYFEQRLDEFLVLAGERVPSRQGIRIGYIGVPPLIRDLYRMLDRAGLSVQFNEVQRQFAMPYGKETLSEQYIAYTYPYSVYDRIKDVKTECRKREIRALVHYTQSFCHRAIDDIVIRKHSRLPILRIETDDNDLLTAKQRTQLEAFHDLIEAGGDTDN